MLCTTINNAITWIIKNTVCYNITNKRTTIKFLFKFPFVIVSSLHEDSNHVLGFQTREGRIINTGYTCRMDGICVYVSWIGLVWQVLYMIAIIMFHGRRYVFLLKYCTNYQFIFVNNETLHIFLYFSYIMYMHNNK